MVDPLGRLVGFDSRVRVANVPDAIKAHGQIEGSVLKLSVQSGEIAYRTDCFLPPNALAADEFSPQRACRGCASANRGPCRSIARFAPNSPMDILQAEVEETEMLSWGGENVKCHVIVYRSDSGSGLNGNDSRGRVWVREDGVVLRQDVGVLRSYLHFVRMSEDEARKIADTLGEDWNEDLPSATARRLLKATRAAAE